jgi:2'-5'-oligoadenylate synthetase 1, domain 2, C-terminus
MEIDILVGATGVKPTDFFDVDNSLVRAYMSSSVSYLSTKFMKEQNPFFKDMVCIIKDWRDSYKSWPSQCKPKSYLLEVLLLHSCREVPNYRKYTTDLLLHFFDMLGRIEPYCQGMVYNKDTVSLKIYFRQYYRKRDIPWYSPEPLFQQYNNNNNKVRYATAVVLDPANPTNNLWLTLADTSTLIRRAQETADAIRRRQQKQQHQQTML